MKPDKKMRLVKFLDRRAFDPVLKISPLQYQGEERQKLEHLQQSVTVEKSRYHTQYADAKEVRRAYFDDLNSSAHKQMEAELKALHLPSPFTLKDEFIDLCEKLDV